MGVALFQRLPRGLKITAEGEALLPTLTNSFDQMAITLDRIEAGQVRELLFFGRGRNVCCRLVIAKASGFSTATSVHRRAHFDKQ
ncbi:hypothetical protein ACOJBO_30455 [Rhizobium beringeri]